MLPLAPRCDALAFNLSKSHKKVIKKMNNFLKHGQKSNQSASSESGTHDGDDDGADPSAMDVSGCGESSALAQYNAITAKQPKIVIDLENLVDVTDKRDDGANVEESAGASASALRGQSDIGGGAVRGHQTKAAAAVSKCGNVHGPDPTKPLRLKAKVLRQQRKLEKQLAKSNGDGVAGGDSAIVDQAAAAAPPLSSTPTVSNQGPSTQVSKGSENTLQSLIAAVPADGQHKLEVDAMHPVASRQMIEFQ